MKNEQGMKIIELRCENFKRLKVVYIKPDGSLVQITGRNSQGKTSVLDAIFAALAGKDAIQTMPIRRGKQEAFITLNLGKLRVTRAFKEKLKEGAPDGYTTSITVQTADGASYSSPQAVLDGLLGELSFDPLSFMRMPAASKRDALKRFVPDIDFDEIAAANKGDYERRTAINRDIKTARSQVEGIILPEVMPQSVDEEALLEEMQSAGEHNTEAEKKRADVERRREGIRRAREISAQGAQTAAKLRAQAEEAESESRALAEKADKQEKEVEVLVGALPDPIDISTVRAKLAEAKKQNAAAKQADDDKLRRDSLLAHIEGLAADSARLTKQMSDREEAKTAALAKAKMPVDGLEITPDGVNYSGVPLEQASDAEQLRVSIAIAAAMSPKLKVIRVRDGSLLDEDGLRMLAEFAEAQDLQIWLERVDSSGKIGFVLEDGMLKDQQQLPLLK